MLDAGGVPQSRAAQVATANTAISQLESAAAVAASAGQAGMEDEAEEGEGDGDAEAKQPEERKTILFARPRWISGLWSSSLLVSLIPTNSAFSLLPCSSNGCVRLCSFFWSLPDVNCPLALPYSSIARRTRRRWRASVGRRGPARRRAAGRTSRRSRAGIGFSPRRSANASRESRFRTTPSTPAAAASPASERSLLLLLLFSIRAVFSSVLSHLVSQVIRVSNERIWMLFRF